MIEAYQDMLNHGATGLHPVSCHIVCNYISKWGSYTHYFSLTVQIVLYSYYKIRVQYAPHNNLNNTHYEYIMDLAFFILFMYFFYVHVI